MLTLQNGQRSASDSDPVFPFESRKNNFKDLSTRVESEVVLLREKGFGETVQLASFIDVENLDIDDVAVLIRSWRLLTRS